MHPNSAALGDQGAVRRKGLLPILLFIALSAVVSSCNKSAPTPVSPPTAGFTLRGLVQETADFDLDVIGAAIVEITTGPSAGESTITDSMGRFEIAGVSGTFNLRISKEGYVATGRTVTVTADVFLNITLDRDDGSDEPGKTFTLSGTVVRKQGSGGPLAGALVEVVDGDQAGYSSTTDGGGNYSIPGLSGEISVKASRDGYEDLYKTVDMTEDVTQIFRLITPPQVTMCLDLDDEEVHITNDDPVNELILTGWRLREVTDNNLFTFVEDRSCRGSMNGFTLAPGATVIITAGDDPEHDPPDYIAGWCESVWESEGDTARLINPETGVVQSAEGRTNCGG
jgi:hypothetical protein